jgi:hypothetical protein
MVQSGFALFMNDESVHIAELFITVFAPHFCEAELHLRNIAYSAA